MTYDSYSYNGVVVLYFLQRLRDYRTPFFKWICDDTTRLSIHLTRTPYIVPFRIRLSAGVIQSIPYYKYSMLVRPNPQLGHPSLKSGI